MPPGNNLLFDAHQYNVTGCWPCNFNQSKCLLICKHEKGLSKHENHLSDLDHSKIYRQFITKGSNGVELKVYSSVIVVYNTPETSFSG